MAVLLVRHAKAGSRKDWSGDDRLRPLSKAGHRQAEALVPLLVGYPITRVLSSPFVRCVQTVLGDHQDAAVAEGWLREAAGASGVSALAAGELIGLQRAEATASREAWPAAWQAVRRAPRSWLG